MNNREFGHPGDHGRFEIQNPLMPPKQAQAEIRVNLLDKVLHWVDSLRRKSNDREFNANQDSR